MNRNGFSVMKATFMVLIIICLAMVIIEQRLEAKDYDQKLKALKRDIEAVELQKRELTQKISREQARLEGSPFMAETIPISLNDVITIRVDTRVKSETSKEKEKPGLLDQVIAYFLNIR